MNGRGSLGFELLRPELALWLVLGTALALALGLWSLAQRRRERERLVARHQLARFLEGFSPAGARARALLASAAVLFLGLTLLGPVRGHTLREVTQRGLDLVVALDTSRSMLVEDLAPSRLARAKREVGTLLERLRGDRVALVGFSGDVRDVAPLTHDRATLRWFLADMSPADNLMGGTDLGGALAHALELFDGRTGAHEAIVLLTDGEDLEGRGLELAEAAAARGIRVYVVGMGTAGGGKIPDGRRGFVTGPDGQEVVSRLADETLRAIAERTGGAYLSAETSALPLEELYEKRLARLEGRELESGKQRIPHDRYQWPLCLALVCMFLAAGMRERRPARMARLGARARREREEAA